MKLESDGGEEGVKADDMTMMYEAWVEAQDQVEPYVP